MSPIPPVPRVGPALSALLKAASAATILALALPSSGAADDELRVLFIGNSYTRYNELPRMVANVAESVDGQRVIAQRETHGGFNLRRHWRIPRVRERIETGEWDAIVLQPHSLSPLSNREEMREYAGRLTEHAAASGAEVVLFETWARHSGSRAYDRLDVAGPEEMQAAVADVVGELARSLGVRVAPVGRAWLEAGNARPDIPLHRDDGTHPAIAGTYLSASELYGTLTGRDPQEARWRPWQISRRRAARIREFAAESLRADVPTATPLP